MLTTSVDPNGLAAVDVNQDGNPDILYIAGNTQANSQATLEVLLGQGDGTFVPGPSTQIPIGFGCCNLTLADVDGDGHVDVILGTRYATSPGVAVFLGNGDGSFRTAVVSNFVAGGGSGSNGTHMAAGDINGDGALDLVVADPQANQIYVLLGDKSGNFKLQNTLPDYGSPTSEYLVDLNGDGHLDLVSVGIISAGATVFLSNGNGGFNKGVRYPTGAATSSLLLADINGDGRPDLIASIYPNLVVVLSGNADGTFAAPVTVFQQDSSEPLLGVGDFNGDGIADIVYATPQGLGVLLGSGGLSFHAAATALSGMGSVNNFAQVDFNKDGHLDVALGVEGGIALLLGNGDGTFPTSIPGPEVYDLGQAVGAATVADFNGDKLADIAVAVAAPAPQLLFGKGNGQFTAGAAPNAGSTPLPVSATLTSADFNGDGKVDVEGSLLAAQPAVALGNGDGTFQAPVSEVNGSSILADVNGDGRTDMLSIQGTNIAVLLGQKDGSFLEVDSALRTTLFPQIAAVGDINGDGRTDLLLFDNGLLEVWLGNGAGSFALNRTQDISATLKGSFPYVSAGLVDLDKDGYLDFLVTIVVPGTPPVLAIFYGAAGATFESPVLIPISHGYTEVTISDVNQDGRPDLVLNDGVSIAIIHNLGSRGFGQENHYLAGAAFNSLTVADVNGDGFPDLIAPTANGDTVAVLLNQPTVSAPGGADTIETLTVTPQAIAYAQPFVVSASIAAAGSSSHAPGGSVTFSVYGVAPVTVALSGNTAVYNFASIIAPGTHTISAAYSGDKYFHPSQASAIVNVAPPTYSTITTVTFTPASPLASQTVRILAAVTSTSPDEIPYGSATFLDAGHSLGAKLLDAGGMAHLDTALLQAGTHIITASYNGITVHTPDKWEILASSISSPVSLPVASTATVTNLGASASSVTAATVVTFTAHVSSAAGTPFGGVTFSAGTTTLGTSALLADGSATFSTANLNPGSQLITASFAPNATFGGSSSAVQTVVVSPAAANFMATVAALNLQQPSRNSAGYSLVAEVQGSARDELRKFSGTVVFLDGGSILGASALGSDGRAVLPLPSGYPSDIAHLYRASFAGSATAAPSVSQALAEEWFAGAPSFRMNAISLPLASIRDGAQVRVQIMADASFQQTVRLSCVSDLPPGYSCNFSPAQVAGSGTSVLTIAPATSLQASHILPTAKVTSVAAGLAAILLCFLRPTKSRYPTAFLLLVLGCSFLYVGCGRSSPSNSAASYQVITIQATAITGQSAILETAQTFITIVSASPSTLSRSVP